MIMQRGFRDKLEKYANINNDIIVEMSVSGNAEYDFCCFGINNAGKLSDDRYMIFYNQTQSPQGEIVFTQSGKTCTFTLKLSRLPAAVSKLVFTVSIDGSQTMHDISAHNISVKQGTDTIASMNLGGSDFQSEKAVISLEIYKKDVWRFAAVAAGFNGGLADLLREYGGEEASDSSSPAPQNAPSYSDAPSQQPTPGYFNNPVPTQQTAVPSYSNTPIQPAAHDYYNSPVSTQQNAPSFSGGSTPVQEESADDFDIIIPAPQQGDLSFYNSPIPTPDNVPSYSNTPSQQSTPNYYNGSVPDQQYTPGYYSNSVPTQQNSPSYSGAPIQTQENNDDEFEIPTHTQQGGFNNYNETAPSPHRAVQKVSLEKKLQSGAPKLVSLAKPLQLELEKRDLQNCIAKVALVLDISGSMTDRYADGTVQEVVNRTLPLAVQFDDDGELDLWFYGFRTKRMPSVNMSNYSTAVPADWQGLMRTLGPKNNEPPVMDEVISEYKKSTIPAYVLFITDGDIYHENKITKLLTKASNKPIFWQFVGIGGYKYGILENLDTMTGRYVDNASFFALDDLNSVSSSELYSRLLQEFPQWLNQIKMKGMI